MSNLSEIKTAISIYDVLDMYDIRYYNKGIEEHIRCPFHLDSDPSCRIYPDVNKLHCYGACARSYDILDLVMHNEGCTLPEAIKFLQEKFGVMELKADYTSKFWQTLGAVKKREEKREKLDLAFAMGKEAIHKYWNRCNPLIFSDLWIEFDKLVLAIKADEKVSVKALQDWYDRFTVLVEVEHARD